MPVEGLMSVSVCELQTHVAKGLATGPGLKVTAPLSFGWNGDSVARGKGERSGDLGELGDEPPMIFHQSMERVQAQSLEVPIMHCLEFGRV